MTEYIVTQQKAGQLVVVLDTSDSFTKEAVMNNLSVGGDETVRKEVEKYMEENVVFWEVEKMGIPVDILKLDDELSSAKEKQIFHNIISVNIPIKEKTGC